MKQAINLCRSPEFRRDYEQHTIPLGQVVDVEIDTTLNCIAERVMDPVTKMQKVVGQEIVLSIKGTARLIVVGHGRDCDGEPLYHLANRAIALPHHESPQYLRQRFEYGKWAEQIHINYGISSLTVVEGQKVELRSLDQWLKDMAF